MICPDPEMCSQLCQQELKLPRWHPEICKKVVMKQLHLLDQTMKSSLLLLSPKNLQNLCFFLEDRKTHDRAPSVMDWSPQNLNLHIVKVWYHQHRMGQSTVNIQRNVCTVTTQPYPKLTWQELYKNISINHSTCYLFSQQNIRKEWQFKNIPQYCVTQPYLLF